MAVGLEVFSVDEHAAHLLFGYAAHANRFCDGAQAAVRGPMRRLINRYNKETAEKLLSEVVALAPGRDCAGVLRNARLRPAFCPAYSMAHHLQRAGASSATNVEESLHERVYKLAGRRQPLMVAMTGAKLVDMKDIEDVDNSRGAGARTSVGCGVLSQQRRESRLRTRARGGGVESAVDEDSVADGDAATAAPKKVARRATRKTKPKAATGAPAPTSGLSSSEIRVLELEKELLEQNNRALTAELALLRASGGGAAPSPASQQPLQPGGMSGASGNMAPPSTGTWATPAGWSMQLMPGLRNRARRNHVPVWCLLGRGRGHHRPSRSFILRCLRSSRPRQVELRGRALGS